MCGIVAWAGKSPNKFNKAKFDLVGSYNEERGIHSCGVSTDGKVAIGVSKNKVFRDFIVNVGYDEPVQIPAVIGHTRHATFGVHNAENAHPFGFGKLNNGFSFVGVHNGSLLNHKDIASKFGVHWKVNKKGREKIDSEVLLEIIYKTKDFKVLSNYNGAAALVFQDLSKPNTIYCWHGASKKYSYDSEDNIWEERPLYYYKETRNSLYISSMKNSLEAIGGVVEKDADKNDIGTIGEFDHNTLYTIVDGNVEKAEKLRISRKGCHYLKDVVSNYNKPNKHNNTNAYKRTGKNFTLDGLMSDDDLDEEEWYKHQGACYPYQNRLNFNVNNVSSDITSARIKFNIYTEKKPEVNMQSKTYVHKLRYWKNSNLLKGCYIFIKGFGFYFMGSTNKKAEEQFWNIVNKEFFAGEFVFSGQKFTSKDEAFIPFEHIRGENEIINPPLFYFYEGIRVLELLDFNRCLTMEAEGKKFDWNSLTHCAAHPIIDLDYDNKSAITQNIKFRDKLFNDTICPMGSNRIYEIKDGNCINISEKKISKSKSDKNFDDIDSIMEKLEENEVNILKKEESNLKKETNTSLTVVNNNCDLLEKAIDDVFKLAFQKFPMDIKRLQVYNVQERAQSAILLLETFLSDARKLIELELKE